MTELLEKAIKKAGKLPKAQQNVIAEIIFEEIEDEKKWQSKFKRTQGKLSKLADEAIVEYRKNKTERLNLQQLESRTTKRFRKAFNNLPKDVKNSAKNAFKKWMQNPELGSLRFKKIHSSKQIYSVRVGRGWRALGIKEGDVMIWFWIGSYADYDILIKEL